MGHKTASEGYGVTVGRDQYGKISHIIAFYGDTLVEVKLDPEQIKRFGELLLKG